MWTWIFVCWRWWWGWRGETHANLCTEKKSVKCNATLFSLVFFPFLYFSHTFLSRCHPGFCSFASSMLRLVVCFRSRYANALNGGIARRREATGKKTNIGGVTVAHITVYQGNDYDYAILQEKEKRRKTTHSPKNIHTKNELQLGVHDRELWKNQMIERERRKKNWQRETHRHRVMVFIVPCKLAYTTQSFNCGVKICKRLLRLGMVCGYSAYCDRKMSKLACEWEKKWTQTEIETNISIVSTNVRETLTERERQQDRKK